MSVVCVPAHAEDETPATFALIIGTNRSVDRELQPLKYADDDAADYFDFFRALGARTYLLSRLDVDTARLHPQAAAEALEPRSDIFERASTSLASDVEQARRRHVQTVVYVVYAGHGNVADDQGYVTLEDARLTGSDLNALVRKVSADSVHLIVDACASYYLAYSRGPGGERRPIGSFHAALSLANDARVGLLLSTSSERESHEWDGFQAGVFSHEVRSGLYGAADADGDGRVTYREIAAFVARANASIPNERFRPDVLARPPKDSDTLVELKRGLSRRIEVDGTHAAHYWIEDAHGIRLMDFHNSAVQKAYVLHPPGVSVLYAHRVEDGMEFVIPNSANVVALADLEPTTPPVAERGAAHAAYQATFSLPFDTAVVRDYRGDLDDSAVTIKREIPLQKDPAPDVRHFLGWGSVGAGALAVGLGATFSVMAVQSGHGTTAQESQWNAAARNRSIALFNEAAITSYITGGVALAAGAALFLWPTGRQFRAEVLPNRVYLGYSAGF